MKIYNNNNNNNDDDDHNNNNNNNNNTKKDSITGKSWEIPRTLKNTIKKLLVSLSFVRSSLEFFKSYTTCYSTSFKQPRFYNFKRKREYQTEKNIPKDQDSSL